MSILTMQNRHESNLKTDEIRPILYTQVLQVLSSRRKFNSKRNSKKNWKIY